MSVFDILFYLICLVSILLLAAIIRLAVAGSRCRTFRLLRLFGVLIGVYLATILATRLAMPIMVYSVGSRQFSGDWFLTVDNWYPEPRGDQKTIVVNFRLTNRADRGNLSEKGLVAYLVDEGGARYDALPNPSAPSFDVVLKPEKTVGTARSFLLPGYPQRLDLVVAHHGFRRSWFVIGRTPFDGTSVVRLQ